MTKDLILSVTKTDCRWDYYRGSGKGGQKRNKTSNCCRCTHIDSGAIGKSEEGRSQIQNRKKAFRRMAESPEFLAWLRVEVSRRSKDHVDIEEAVGREMGNVVVEGRDEAGRWVKIGD